MEYKKEIIYFFFIIFEKGMLYAIDSVDFSLSKSSKNTRSNIFQSINTKISFGYKLLSVEASLLNDNDFRMFNTLSPYKLSNY